MRVFVGVLNGVVCVVSKKCRPDHGGSSVCTERGGEGYACIGKYTRMRAKECACVVCVCVRERESEKRMEKKQDVCRVAVHGESPRVRES